MAAGTGTCVVLMRRPGAAAIAVGMLRVTVAIRPGVSARPQDDRPAARADPLRPVGWLAPGAYSRAESHVVFIAPRPL